MHPNGNTYMQTYCFHIFTKYMEAFVDGLGEIKLYFVSYNFDLETYKATNIQQESKNKDIKEIIKEATRRGFYSQDLKFMLSELIAVWNLEQDKRAKVQWIYSQEPLSFDYIQTVLDKRGHRYV